MVVLTIIWFSIAKLSNGAVARMDTPEQVSMQSLPVSPGGSLSHISATHPCAHTSKSAPKWRNLHHQILHP